MPDTDAPTGVATVDARGTSLQRRQMLTERLLVDVVGMGWATVHTEAEAIAAASSPLVEEGLTRLLGDPGTCPHGNPIPGSAHQPDQSQAVPLASAESVVEIVRIGEEIEGDVTVMCLLEAAGLIPGRWAEIRRHTVAGIEVLGARAEAVIPFQAAAHVHVNAVDLSRD